ncbi:MAG: aminotransferase class I/II-fold pyridoxal phosphate-dependent enzyme [Ruminococcaceae bacterium]|nr:aminotransferase class I/II-fold pyridoxal phosphate-dependent enzyme [Oscillospiraceae bacterium]
MSQLNQEAEALVKELPALRAQYQAVCEEHLSLDMSRGKPCAEQLSLSDELLFSLKSKDDCLTASGFDIRNYGLPGGVPELAELFAELLDVPAENIILGGNSSLNMMYDTVCRAILFGTYGNCLPWKDQGKIKFLCPVPGYDRHFSICKRCGIDLVAVPMTGKGPDMDIVEEKIKDPSIKGIWCVPKYSNPSGETYSDETVRRIASMRPAAPDFRVFWDLAYVIHDLEDTTDKLLNIFDLIKGTENENMVYAFFSTSKITYPGAGIAAMVSSKENIRHAKEDIAYQTISPDKINQLRHMKFLKDADTVYALMKQHARILKPKFDMTVHIFEKYLAGLSFVNWTNPRGGYFISLNVMPKTAKRVAQLAKEAGVILTPAGATFPYNNDPEDRNLRIAPSYPSVDEVEKAMTVVSLCVKLAAAEKFSE